jgi:methenyltetrahydromethanopterin cyclohydrolase
MTATLTLNEQALQIADHMAANAAALRINVHQSAAGARILDCGVAAEGGLQAGLCMARVCLAGLGDVTLVPAASPDLPCPTVQVLSDQPVRACMASQYAGWQITGEKYFAMGSGPMRAAYGKEALFDDVPGREQPPVAVGVLETRKLPPDAVIASLAEQVRVPPDRLTLLAAPPYSLAGNLQVVARSLETALHKLHELKFDLSQVVSGVGTAPLAPVAADQVTAIGRTNDAIIYGGRVVLWVRADDAQLAAVGPKVPASAEKDYGSPFAEIFERYERDFYRIDPLLFSPAEVLLHNLKTGRSHHFGRLAPDVLRRSFFPAG